MLEGGVGVHLGEAAIEHGDADAAAVDARRAEEVTLHAHHLHRQMAGEGGVERGGLVGPVGLAGQLHVALDGLHAEHVGQPFDGGGLVGRGHHADGVHPAAGAHLLGGQRVDACHIAGVERIVALVVEVGAALGVAFQREGVEVGVGVEGGARLVGEEHPPCLLGRGSDGEQHGGQCGC